MVLASAFTEVRRRFTEVERRSTEVKPRSTEVKRRFTEVKRRSTEVKRPGERGDKKMRAVAQRQRGSVCTALRARHTVLGANT